MSSRGTPESVPQGGSANESGSSNTGFRTFWRKSDKGDKGQNLTFVHQDPGTKQKKNRISRILKHSASPSSQDDGEEPLSSAQKRRQQVYQAQKRHRSRQADYVRNLEAEVARLQHLDSVVNNEKNALAHQNNAIKEFLAKQSIDAQLESVNLGSTSTPSDELSDLGGAAVDIRFDPELGHERVFLDLGDAMWTSSETSTQDQQAQRPTRHAPVAGDSWAALDFILALEWPCRAHVKHHGLNPDTAVPTACAQGNFHGHALTATAAVFESAFSPASVVNTGGKSTNEAVGLDPSTMHNWMLPHSEIDKLVELAEMLELDDEYMTPAQAYSAVRETVPNETYLRPTLQALKTPLGSLTQCHGFGACMDAPMFWQHLDATIQTLQFTHPELAQ